jgi:hypothetical protein
VRTISPAWALDLLKQLMPPAKAIRLIGISASGFADSEPDDQLPLMFDESDVQG